MTRVKPDPDFQRDVDKALDVGVTPFTQGGHTIRLYPEGAGPHEIPKPDIRQMIAGSGDRERANGVDPTIYGMLLGGRQTAMSERPQARWDDLAQPGMNTAVLMDEIARACYKTGPFPPLGKPSGQFMSFQPNPLSSVEYAPGKLYKCASNKLPMAELESIWRVCGPDAARTVARNYVAAFGGPGRAHAFTGPILRQGYNASKHEYPAWIDWRNDRDGWIAFLRMCREEGLQLTLMVLPTDPPYYVDGEFKIDAIERDLTPFFSGEPQELIGGTCFAWEWYTRQKNMTDAGRWYARTFPQLLRRWHNPPDHLSPCASDEHEETGWRAFAPFIHEFFLQSAPPDDERFVNGHDPGGNTPITLMTYQLTDIQQRFNGQHSAWPGGPILGAPWPGTGDVKPIQAVYAEALAHAQYYDDAWQHDGPKWAKAAREAGSAYSLDGAE